MDSNDPIMQTRLDVAEMKGMLSQIVSSHEAQLSSHSTRLETHDLRLNAKGQMLARHDERLKDLEDDNTAKNGKSIALTGIVISGLVSLIAVYNFISGLPVS